MLKRNAIFKVTAFFLLIAYASIFLSAQDADSSDTPVDGEMPAADEIQSAEDNQEVSKGGSSFGVLLFAPSIELETAMIGLTPAFSGFADFGFRLAPEIVLGLRAGFTYCLPLWEDTWEEMYIPLGLRLSLPKTLFLETLYYLPVDFTFNRLRLRVSAGGEAIVAAGSSVAFGITAGLGMGIFRFTDTDEIFLPVNVRLGFRLYF